MAPVRRGGSCMATVIAIWSTLAAMTCPVRSSSPRLRRTSVRRGARATTMRSSPMASVHTRSPTATPSSLWTLGLSRHISVLPSARRASTWVEKWQVTRPSGSMSA